MPQHAHTARSLGFSLTVNRIAQSFRRFDPAEPGLEGRKLVTERWGGGFFDFCTGIIEIIPVF
jgi:hypothetical protein